MGKTIKQIADELGVSKQAVRKWVYQLPPTEVSTSINRAILITPHGEAILKGLVSTKVSTKVSTEVPTKTPLVDTLLKQIEAKDRQIETLERLLDQEQQLSLEAARKIDVLLKQKRPLFSLPFRKTDPSQ